MSTSLQLDVATPERVAMSLPVAGIAAVIALRAVFEHWRSMVAHETAARVQKRLRRRVYDQIAALGPATVGAQRSGALAVPTIAR